MSWEYSSIRSSREHDLIQDALHRRLAKFSKRELEGISWSRNDLGQYPYKSDKVLQKEKQISGELPSGKAFCRMDLSLRVGDERLAFEVKTSKTDAKNWPEQATDYRSAGYDPIIVTTVEVVAALGPGHRLVTGSDYIIAHDQEFRCSVSNPPAAASDFFAGGTPFPFETVLDHCPSCGYRLVYRAQRDGGIRYRCKACDFSLR